MHTFQQETKDCGLVLIHHNSDLSGRVTIQAGKRGSQVSVEVPAKVLVEFVAEWVRVGRITKLENMETNELLGL